MSDTTSSSPIDAGASEADGAHNPVDAGSTPVPATTAPDVPVDPRAGTVTDMSVGVNAQGETIPVAHDAINAGAANLADRNGQAEGQKSTASVSAAHHVNGTHTVFTVDTAGEGRHLVEIRVTPTLVSGDVFRHAFSGVGCEFAVEGLAASGTATVTDLQGDGRPQDVGDVTAGVGSEVRFDVVPLEQGAVTPDPDPGLPEAPSVAFAAEQPTDEEVAAANEQAAAERDRQLADAGDEFAPSDLSSAVPADSAVFTQPPGSGAEGLGAPDGVEPQKSPAPPSLTLPGAVDVNGDPLPEGTDKPAKFADGDIGDGGSTPAGDGTPGA